MTTVANTPGCEGCSLAASHPNRPFIPPIKASSARLVVGKCATQDDEFAGTPFSGGPANILASMYRKAGVSFDTVCKTNVLCCRPPNDEFPEGAESKKIVSHCVAHHLQPTLASRPFTRIDAVGQEALQVLTGETPIDRWRGSALPLVGEQKPKVVGLLEPLRLMKDSSMIPATISDLQKSTQVPPQHYNTQPTLTDLENFTSSIVTFDIETHGFTKQIMCVGITDKVHHAMVVPFRGAYIPHLKRIFANATVVIGQNIIGFDLGVMAEAGVTIKPDCLVMDIMLIQHLLQPDMPHDLGFIASIWTNMQAWKHTMRQDMEWYNACDVDATLQIFNAMQPVLKRQGLDKLYRFVQVPLARICKQMSETGIKVDPNKIAVARDKFIEEMRQLEASLPAELQPYDKAIRVRERAPAGTLGKSGKPIKFIHVPGTERVVPWNSPQLVGRYLYETLKLPKQLHPKTKKLSTDKTALAKLFKLTQRAEIDALRQIQSLDTLLSSFLKDGDGDVQVAAGRIHSNFLVHGTATGRLSSSGPNLQNIPKKARYIYVPSFADWGFIEADFSSLENRLAAWYAQDTERLQRMSIPGFNEHRWFASKLFGIPEADITGDMREYKLGKIGNHGADGGLGPRKLSLLHGISEKEAKELLLKWKEINWKSAKWQENVGNEAAREGILTNAFGRKRWFWSNSAYTEGIRFLPQSSGADICYRAMVAMLYDRVGTAETDARKVAPILAPLPHPARLVLQVHDSLLVEAPLAIRDEVAKCMRAAMTQPWAELAGMSIPVAIKVGEAGDSWAELKEYT